MKRIVLTGPPCSGKTVVSAAICSALANFVLVPEAATQVYAAEGTRWDSLDLAGRKDRQRKIYQLQLRQEEEFALGHAGKDLLLDRGTLDGAAYWPDGPEAYWLDMGTTRQAELARYDGVIFMETAAAMGVYAPQSNAARFEDAAGAIDNSRRLAAIWADHPDLIMVPAFDILEEKIAAVRRILNRR
jgi:predicted ATPase